MEPLDYSQKFVGTGYSFDDVLLLQAANVDLESRRDTDLRSTLAIGVPQLNYPIVSSNMNTVTERRMATRMAQLGGIGFIHRFMSPKQEAEEVRCVKQHMRVVDEQPPWIKDTATVSEALAERNRHNRGYLLVYSDEPFNGQISGILTDRDIRDASDPQAPISTAMTKNVLTVPQGTTLEEAVAFMKSHKIEKVPIMNPTDNRIVGVFSQKDHEKMLRYPNASKDNKGRLMVGAAIGVRDFENEITRALLLQDAGVDTILIDIAHGGLVSVPLMIRTLRDEGITIPIIGGNVSNYETAADLVEAGASAIKVGVGPGLICITRLVAGAGMPQITAVWESRRAADKYADDDYPIIADGGIRNPGDGAKVVAAGANTVMIGSLFGGTEESPGELVSDANGQSKIVYGMASADATRVRKAMQGIEENGTHSEDVNVEGEPPDEGRKIIVPYRGYVSRIFFKLAGGLRSGMSYAGAKTIKEMQKMGQFIVTTPAGASENTRAIR